MTRYLNCSFLLYLVLAFPFPSILNALPDKRLSQLGPSDEVKYERDVPSELGTSSRLHEDKDGDVDTAVIDATVNGAVEKNVAVIETTVNGAIVNNAAVIRAALNDVATIDAIDTEERHKKQQQQQQQPQPQPQPQPKQQQ